MFGNSSYSPALNVSGKGSHLARISSTSQMQALLPKHKDIFSRMMRVWKVDHNVLVCEAGTEEGQLGNR